MKKNKVIMFDFDGVIVNTLEMGLTINQEYFGNIEYSEIQDWAEGNVYSKKLREEEGNGSEVYYFEQYSKRVTELVPVDGVEDIFKELIRQKFKIIIVSSADEEAIENYLKTHNLDKYITKVMARKTSPSKVEKFKMVFEEFKIKAKETLLITDSVGDVKEAHEVKMKAIGVLWGLHERERLERNGVDFIAERPEDILIGIKKILTLN